MFLYRFKVHYDTENEDGEIILLVPRTPEDILNKEKNKEKIPERHTNSIQGKTKSGLTSLIFFPPWKSILHKLFKSGFLKIMGPKKLVESTG